MNKNVIFPTLGSDYINASWLHGHGKLKEFIITQHPTLNVKEDFWRMLWDHNAQTDVLLLLSCKNLIVCCFKSAHFDQIGCYLRYFLTLNYLAFGHFFQILYKKKRESSLFPSELQFFRE